MQKVAVLPSMPNETQIYFRFSLIWTQMSSGFNVHFVAGQIAARQTR